MTGLEFCLLGYLGYAAVWDMRTRKIPMFPAVIAGVTAIVWQLVEVLVFGELSLPELGASLGISMLPGIGLLLVSAVTREAIGYGDGISLLLCGLYLGGKEAAGIFLTASLLSGIWALGLLVLRKKEFRQEMPFLPFLLLGYLSLKLMTR